MRTAATSLRDFPEGSWIGNIRNIIVVTAEQHQHVILFVIISSLHARAAVVYALFWIFFFFFFFNLHSRPHVLIPLKQKYLPLVSHSQEKCCVSMGTKGNCSKSGHWIPTDVCQSGPNKAASERLEISIRFEPTVKSGTEDD